jgi:hypothetical protein
MFCPNCGTQVADAASFCRKCGASLRDDAAPPTPQPVQPQSAPAQPVSQQPAQQQVMTQPRPVPRAFAATGPVQPVVGIVVIIGAALAAIGSFTPWIDIAGATANGFDGGYLTGGSAGDGNDGILILLLALAAGGLAVHYFMRPIPMASIAGLVLGAAAAVLAGYNLIRLSSDIRDMCGDCNPMEYLGYGLYLSVAGGAIAAGAAYFGLRRERST